MMNLKLRNAFLLALLAIAPAMGSDEGPRWSPPVNGLRARLLVLPPRGSSATPFDRVFVEFENVGDVAGQKRVRFIPERIRFRVVDQGGKELPTASGPYDGIAPLWDPLLIPYAGSMKFQISFPGFGYRPNRDRVIVDMGPSMVWVVPQDGSKYCLSGSLSIPPVKGDHPIIDWSGTLDLPAVEIPRGI
jgi:hypothetical protein